MNFTLLRGAKRSLTCRAISLAILLTFAFPSPRSNMSEIGWHTHRHFCLRKSNASTFLVALSDFLLRKYPRVEDSETRAVVKVRVRTFRYSVSHLLSRLRQIAMINFPANFPRSLPQSPRSLRVTFCDVGLRKKLITRCRRYWVGN